MARRTRWWRCAALIVALILAGCSGSDPGGDEAEGPGTTAPEEGVVQALDATQRAHLVEEGETTWDVTYDPSTTVVSGTALSSVIGSDPSSGTYTFDADAADAAGLELAEGRVLLLAGQAVRRITGVEQRGGETTVTTEQATLADAIDEGTVGWDVPIRFEFDQFLTAANGGSGPSNLRGSGRPTVAGGAELTSIAMRMPDGRTVPVQSSDEIGREIEDSIEVKPEQGAVEWTYGSHGNKYQFRLTSKGDAVDILVVVSRESGRGATMAFRGEGTIGSMRSVSSSNYHDGELTGSDVELQELTSDLDLSLSVAGAGVSPVDFEIPVPMLTYTWLVGPVPVTLDLTAEIIGNVDAQANASATAESSFTYRGSAGFTFEGTDVSTSGSTDVDEMDPEPADSAAGMGIDVDAQFGLGFPSVSLSVLGQGLVPHLRAGAVIGSHLQWGGPAAGFPASSICKSAYVRMEVSGGYDFMILGESLAGDKFTLYEDKNETEADNCPDEG